MQTLWGVDVEILSKEQCDSGSEHGVPERYLLAPGAHWTLQRVGEIALSDHQPRQILHRNETKTQLPNESHQEQERNRPTSCYSVLRTCVSV